MLNLMVIRQVKTEEKFKYHWGGKELRITSLCFANDLLMLCHRDLVSASVLRRGFDEFCLSSGLHPSMTKSEAFFGNVYDKCYCYVCDVAAPCKTWYGGGGHCHALDTEEHDYKHPGDLIKVLEGANQHVPVRRGRLPLIVGYLMNINKKRALWSLNEDILKFIDYDYQYAVSIKEDTAYPCLHSPKTTKETSSIRRIQ
nr:RNA-directed DNA polymerase, eukaryota, reverse transcriptase zinc-binding domain protein [Tanacetum cinerariifolium]